MFVYEVCWSGDVFSMCYYVSDRGRILAMGFFSESSRCDFYWFPDRGDQPVVLGATRIMWVSRGIVLCTASAWFRPDRGTTYPKHPALLAYLKVRRSDLAPVQRCDIPWM